MIPPGWLRKKVFSKRIVAATSQSRTMTGRRLSMTIGQAAFNLLTVNPFAWRSNWAWGLPLIVLTAVIHVVGLGLVGLGVGQLVARIVVRGRPESAFVGIIGAITLLATIMHGIEVYVWAVAYWLLGALPDLPSSVLYSLNAMTSYGHTNESLEFRWGLMGALEALNGWLLFGLTTAFLFAVIQKLWSLGGRARAELQPGSARKIR
jgi:hypothetical protein